MNALGQVWNNQFAYVRSRFVSAAAEHYGIKCSLLREPRILGEGSVGRALDLKRNAADALGPRIGGLASGVAVANRFQTEHYSYVWWLFHPRLMNAQLPDDGSWTFIPRTSPEFQAALKCEQEFGELAREAGRLLSCRPAEQCPSVLAGATLQGPKNYVGVWILELFHTAQHPSQETLLQSPKTSSSTKHKDASQRLRELLRKLPYDKHLDLHVELDPPSDDCVQTLDFNPFSASVALIDLQLTNEKLAPTPTEQSHAVPITPKVDPPNVVLPEVDLQRNQVRHGEKCFNVSPDAAILFSELVKSFPQAIAANKLFSKPSRVKDSLPEELYALVDTAPGKGYRLKLG